MRDVDVAIIGSGWGGSLLAMIARRLGRSVLLVEKDRHPRFAIGESSTPLANLLWEELSDRYNLPFLKPFSKWGSWQRAYPEVACGLKRGFSFFHDEDELLVGASPRDEIADTHWYRPDFDHHLVKEAVRLGVDYRDQVELSGVEPTQNGVVLSAPGWAVRAGLLVDASGPRGFLHRSLQLGELPLPGYPETEATFAHFTGVGGFPPRGDDPPFPRGAAAVHYLFPEGWLWVLRFNNGVTSAGAVTIGPSPRWDDLVQRVPDLARQFASAQRITGWRHVERLPFRSARVADRRWALLPSSAGFVDPLLSTGFPLNLLGIARLARVMEGEGDLAAYAADTDRDLLAAADLIGALYANLSHFPVFRALTLLYFAAVSFSESAWRLGKRHLASSFLLRDDPRFGPECRRLLRRARRKLDSAEREALIGDILKAIEPFDVAGWRRSHPHDWYPVDTADLLNGAVLLQSTRGEIHAMLANLGIA